MRSSGSSSESDLIDVDEYVARFIREMEAFRAWWHAQHALDPIRFPEKLAQGDWDEQFTWAPTGEANE